METMSFRIGIDDYLYYNSSVQRKNDKLKDLVPTEIHYFNILDKGEKNK
jgi:hypothetical protein